MHPRLADAFVSVLSPGTSLRAWRAMGVADRNAPMYQALRAHYGRVIIVSDDTAGDGAGVLGEGIEVFGVGGDAEHLVHAAHGLARTLTPGSHVVVKTDELSAGVRAVEFACVLEHAGVRRSLIARGGHLWSRFAAHERGADSREARDAAVCEGSLLHEADLVIATTRSMSLDLAWRYQLPGDSLREVPNYVLTELGGTGLDDREKGLILSAGELTPRKRFDILVRAVALLPEAVRHTSRVVIVGDGPERANLESLARELGVKMEFAHAMPHAELLALMRRACIYACSSEFEGHPRCVLEAMHSGAAVIVADSPGLATVVQNGVTGLKVINGPEPFAHSIGALLDDDDWRLLLGNAANRAVGAEFSFERVLTLEVEAHAAAIGRSLQRRKAA